MQTTEKQATKTMLNTNKKEPNTHPETPTKKNLKPTQKHHRKLSKSTI
jgi:hypothetical protein